MRLGHSLKTGLVTAVVLLLAVLVLSGCGTSDSGSTSMVKAGETIASDSKWINSDIEGAIDESTPTSLKDDFYTAVNRDWLLATTLTEEEPQITAFNGCDTLIRERKLAIVGQSQDGSVLAGESNPTGLTGEQLAHNQSLLSTFAGLAGDWTARNTQGVEPARPYIEAIESIDSMEAMTAYLLNQNGMKLGTDHLVGITVQTGFSDRDTNTVMLAASPALVLKDQSAYSDMTDDGIFYKEYNNEKVNYLLGRLGYDEGEIRDILAKCYGFEGRLASAMKSRAEQNSIEYLQTADNTYTMEQIEGIQGDYPLTAILTSLGVDHSDRYTVCEPDYVTALGKLYTEGNLEEMKSYYLVHTLDTLLPLLDREAFDKHTEIKNSMAGKTSKNDGDKTPDGDAEDDKKTEETAILLDSFIGTYLAEPMDEIYIAQYCDASQKAEVKALIEETIAYYRVMLQDEDWLSEETRNGAVDKLDNLTVRAVYPDTFTDYSELSFEGDSSLVESVASINAYQWKQMAEKVNAPVNRNEWNLTAMSTTVVNAYYSPVENSINILAGILADGTFYRSDMPREEKLARLGSIIGHEITHAFDTTGSQFDKDGRAADWWQFEDTATFQTRTTQMTKYYAALTPYPGSTGYASNVTSEAIADMGGVKCMLALGKETPDFNYQQFFTSYAELWQKKTTYEREDAMANRDEHPLAFLRVNVTLQQFDEFNTAFGIAPGDGMYINPEDRILVW